MSSRGARGNYSAVAIVFWPTAVLKSYKVDRSELVGVVRKVGSARSRQTTVNRRDDEKAFSRGADNLSLLRLSYVLGDIHFFLSVMHEL